VAKHVRPLDWFKRRPIQVGIDFGYEFPGAVWAQVDPVEERLRVLKSWGPRNLTAAKLASGVLERSRAWFPHATFAYYAGHDGNAKKDTNEKTSADIFGEHGIRPTIRWTAKERGFGILRALLDMRDDGEPGLYVDPGNPLLIEALLGGYRYDPKKEDETIKTGPYPPLVDALRYIAVNTFTTAGTLPRLAPVPAFRGLTPLRSPWGRRSLTHA
jgi:hypothetical protein